MDKKSFVFATGGLGNQLFQLAAALGSKNRTLFVVPNQENARKNNAGHLDIEDFLHGEEIIISRDYKLWKISLKAINFTLRNFAGMKTNQSIRAFNTAVLFATSFLLSLNLKTHVMAIANRGLGYDENIMRPGKYNFFIGYFQSFKFVERPEVIKTMRSMKLKTHSIVLEEFQSLSENEAPLVVHVRMGDYQDSDLFGILPKKYYEQAIEHLWRSGIYKKIWLFSDEPQKAINQIPEKYLNDVRVIPDFDNSTPITFEVMRLGHGYVIANSSFSWWAASLAHFPNPDVVAPDVWFKKSGSPNQILPPDWIKVSAWK